MNTVDDLKNTFKNDGWGLTDLPIRFQDNCYTYQIDNRACKSLNKLLDTNFIAVYRQTERYKTQWKSNKIDWDCETFYVITSKFNIVRMFNSEWGDFQHVG